jgi:saccharopine dehydrogenase (NAD+, L-lysine-forming)
METVLIIGAGGVGRVVANKCVQNSKIFQRIVLASRTISKCIAIKNEVDFPAFIAESIDADNVDLLIELIIKYNPKVVINVALPYQDLTIMEACLQTQTHYVDTANYEHPSVAKFEYKEQWAFDDKFKQKDITALLGSGFDPGVTNIFCAYADKYLFDEIKTIDIYDCNDGDNGYKFATNFNPEINLREVSANGRYWKNQQWIETKPMEIKKSWNYPEIGVRDSYLIYHEELESLTKNIKGLQQIRFFMTFSESYLQHMNCLQNVGMLGIDEVEHNGVKIVPISFLKTLLPDPANIGSNTKGKTNIGVVINGVKDNIKRKYYIYNVCDHQEAFKETKAQAVSYTTGVPAMIGAKLIMQKIWQKRGVLNIEEFEPKYFMDELKEQGLPWNIIELDND